MKRFNRFASIGMIGALTVGTAFATGCNGPNFVNSVVLCVDITASPAESLENQTATITMVAQVYGIVRTLSWSGQIIGGEVCLNPTGLPPFADSDDFNSANAHLSVSVTDASGNTLTGIDTNPSNSYDSDDYVESINSAVTVSSSTGTSTATPPSIDGGASAMLHRILRHHGQGAPREGAYDRNGGGQRDDAPNGDGSGSSQVAGGARV